MPEIIHALLTSDSFQKFCDLAPKPWNSSLGSFSQQRLEFAEEQLNWIEVRRKMGHYPWRRYDFTISGPPRIGFNLSMVPPTDLDSLSLAELKRWAVRL